MVSTMTACVRSQVSVARPSSTGTSSASALVSTRSHWWCFLAPAILGTLLLSRATSDTPTLSKPNQTPSLRWTMMCISKLRAYSSLHGPYITGFWTRPPICSFYSQVIVPFAIKALKDAGYRLVTLAECLGKPAYQWQAAPQARDVRTIFS